jgi:hypothetical protein
MDYLVVSKDVKATGISASLVSAGAGDKLSFGFSFGKQMFIEKIESTHISLNITDIGLLVGKQLGSGKVEILAGARGVEHVYGPNLALNAYQWLSSSIFLNANIGAGIIGNSTLLDLGGGIGFGGETMQLILGYRSLQSSNNELAGPQIKFRITF